jgi:hypothetical protein
MRKAIAATAAAICCTAAILAGAMSAGASTTPNRSLLYDVPCVEIGHVVYLSSASTVPSQYYTWCRLVEVEPAYLGEVKFQAPNGVYSDVYKPLAPSR